MRPLSVGSEGAPCSTTIAGYRRPAEEFRRGLHLFAEASRFDIDRVLLWSFARTIEDAMWELSVGDEEDSRRSLGYARLVRRLLRARGE